MARISATGADRRHATAGFTLVELMVVLAIVGLVASAVVLSVPGDGDALVRQADRFGTHLERAREEALLGTRPVELVADARGYAFRRQRFGGWQALHDGPFAPVAWEPGVHPLRLPQGGHMTFRFDAIGATSPQALVLAQDARRIRVVVDGAGEVAIHAATR